jgi:hypothetical protein
VVSEQTKLIVRAIFGALLLGYVAYKVVAGGCAGAEPGNNNAEGADDAVEICQQNIAKQLKAPATAVFGKASATKTDEDKTWEVTGSVDAQNGFGALIRASWSCKAQHVDGDRWHVDATLNE